MSTECIQCLIFSLSSDELQVSRSHVKRLEGFDIQEPGKSGLMNRIDFLIACSRAVQGPVHTTILKSRSIRGQSRFDKILRSH